jgi:hypothetical protein
MDNNFCHAIFFLVRLRIQPIPIREYPGDDFQDFNIEVLFKSVNFVLVSHENFSIYVSFLSECEKDRCKDDTLLHTKLGRECMI